MVSLLDSDTSRRVAEKNSLVYICSKYRGKNDEEIRENILRAEKYSRFVYMNGYLPLCVHTFLERVTGLSETSGHREELLYLGKRYVRRCGQIWVFGNVSEGMSGEILEAKSLKKPILYFDSEMRKLAPNVD